MGLFDLYNNRTLATLVLIVSQADIEPDTDGVKKT